MQVKTILYVVSMLLACLGLSLSLPLFTAWYFDESMQTLLLSMLILLGIGLFSASKTKPQGEVNISNREGIAIVSFCWIMAGVAGALPYVLGGYLSFPDAIFESVSGFTTTGATILIDIEALPKGILMWRALTHWLGGMGIIVLTLAILPILGMGGMQLYKAEVTGPKVDKIVPRIHDTALFLWLVYFLMTIIETVLLMFGGLDWFDAVAHTFSTVATGGFSTQNTSITNYSPYIQWVITVFMFLAGVNFTLHFRALVGRGNLSVYKHNTECKLYFVLTVLGASLIAFTQLWSNSFSDIEYTIRTAFFQVISIETSTGFATADYELWSPLCQGILLYFLLMGACAGSTGGGIKVMRISLIFKMASHELMRVLHPRVIRQIKHEKKPVSQDVLNGVMAFFILYCLLLFVGGLFVLAFGHDFLTAFSSVATCLSNVGPGFGNIGPTENFAFFQAPVKFFLSLIMICGRLEIFTVLLLFTPHFWKS